MFADRANQPSVLAKLGKSRPVRLRAGEGSRLMRLRSPAVGVKVCDNALCLASVRPGLGRGWVVSTGRMEDYAQLTSDQFAEKLRNFLEPLRGEEPILVLGLPRRQSVVRISVLPKSGPQSAARGAGAAGGNVQACRRRVVLLGRFGEAFERQFLPSAWPSPRVSKSIASRPCSRPRAIRWLRITLSQFALAQLVLRNHPDSRSRTAGDCRCVGNRCRDRHSRKRPTRLHARLSTATGDRHPADLDLGNPAGLCDIAVERRDCRGGSVHRPRGSGFGSRARSIRQGAQPENLARAGRNQQRRSR